jgi:Skp family chaperone for outer membrane proteins
MKVKSFKGGAVSAAIAVALFISASSASLSAAPGGVAQTQSAAQATVSPKHREAFAAFEARVKEYVSMRESLEEKLPKLSKDAKPEEIEAHKNALQESVRRARTSAKPGDIFAPEVARHIREVIKSELKPATRQEVRQTVLESEVKAVPLRVNYPYPESEEQIEMPPTLLLRLPQLPKQVRYRYVGRNMLLVDRENGLIIDFMPDALP